MQTRAALYIWLKLINCLSLIYKTAVKLASIDVKSRITPFEELYTNVIRKDISSYHDTVVEHRDRVLLFPPVNSFRRLLIHKIAFEVDPQLATFSIGQYADRRTVVCLKTQLIKELPECEGAVCGSGAPVRGVRSTGNNSFISSSDRAHASTSAQPVSERRTHGTNGRAENRSSVDLYRPPAARRAGVGAVRQRPRRSAELQAIIEDVIRMSPLASAYEAQKKNRENTKAANNMQARPDGERLPLNRGSKHRERRPDRAVYVPRPKRTANKEARVPDTPKVTKGATTDREHSEIKDGHFNDVIVMNKVNSSDNNHLALRPSSDMADRIYIKENPGKIYDMCKKLADDGDILELQRASEEINRSNRRIMKQSFVSDVLLISENSTEVPEPTKADDTKEKDRKENVNAETASKPARNTAKTNAHKVNPEEDDWDTLYDDNGDCLDPSLWQELTSFVGKVTIAKPSRNYKIFQDKAQKMLSSDDGMAHVLEVYDFPAEFKTQDLLAVFAPYKEAGFDLKWVDDTHALAVFSSIKIAEEALSQPLPFVKTRPLREGTAQSRQKAHRSAEFLQPFKARPETCTALARRLVSGALGVKLKTAQEEREHEKLILKEAKERKMLATRLSDQAWEDDYASPIKH